jgi:dGTPase
MDWNKLMSKKRLCQDQLARDYPSRTDYQKDYDRIAFCSPFRRLQDKAQVFPLSENDYVRTRLTHSLEVSCVGRSLGSIVGEKIIKSYGMTHIDPFDFGVVTSAACLAHDIGNTPLGHSGEHAIREWFENSNIGKSIVNNLSDNQQKNDFLKYQGNAQGFRFLAKLQWPSSRGGLQLTSAVLGAFVKYPRPSTVKDDRLKDEYEEKFSFFYDDQNLFVEVAEDLGLVKRYTTECIWCRHPLAFLVEAADDICYHIIDIEDGHRLGQIEFDQAKSMLMKLIDEDYAKKKIAPMVHEKDIIECLRAMVIGCLVNEVSKKFIENLEALTEGSFNEELTKCIAFNDEFSEFKKIAKEKIYTARQIIEIEAAGYSVIEKLLEFFIKALQEQYEFKCCGGKMSSRSKTIIQLIPESFIGQNKIPSSDLYIRVLRMVDYIAGMTDSFAVSVYKKMMGILL